jgi:UDP-N-acetyl-D-galactosamine dehydrogenase
LRNSRVIDVITELKDFGVNVQVADPQADADEARHEYGVELTPLDKLTPADAVVVAVSHREFAELAAADWLKLCRTTPVLIDIKGTLDKESLLAAGAHYWRL